MTLLAKNTMRLIAVATALSLLIVMAACGSTPTAQGSSSQVDSSSQTSSSTTTDTATGSTTGFELAIPLQYDLAGRFTDGLALVGAKTGEQDGLATYKYSYIDKTGKVVIELPTEIVEAGEFAAGMATVYRKDGTNSYMNEYNFIDKTGKVLMDKWLTDGRGMGGGGEYASRFIYLDETQDAKGLPKYWTARTSDATALMDSKLNVVIPYGQYDYMYWIEDTDFAVASQSSGGFTSIYGVVRLDGSVFIPVDKYTVLDIHKIGFAVTSTEGASLELILYDGRVVKPQIAGVTDLQSVGRDNAVAFCTGTDYPNQKWGIMDLDGKVLVEAVHPNSVEIPSYEYNPWGGYTNLLDDPNAPAAPTDMVLLGYNDNSFVFATGNEFDPTTYAFDPAVRVGLAGLSGNVLVEPTLEAVSNIVCGVYLSSSGIVIDQYGSPVAYAGLQLVLADGSVRSDGYDSFGVISGGMIAVSKDGKYGFIQLKP